MAVEQSGMQNGGIRAEDVITKLKDDGDFDRLRIKIIRKFKENEELRESITSLVKQSAALNSPGAENMKPRQLSDAIHREIGDKLMNQVSDGLWSIIRSTTTDGMKTEINETIQSVYEKVFNLQRTGIGGSSSSMNSHPIHSEIKNNLDTTNSAGEIDREPDEPPGFGPSTLHQSNKANHMDQQNNIGLHPSSRKRKAKEGVKDKKLHAEDFTEPNNFNPPPLGFSSFLEHDKSGGANDEDPDVPPGFG